jgi:hypothetical protein
MEEDPMSERYSPEPWHTWPYAGDVWDVGVGAEQSPDAPVVVAGASRANAHRIVAAVNAVAGISTEALEAGKLGEALDILMKARPFLSEQCLEYDRECLNCRWIEVLRSLGRLPSTDNDGGGGL